MADGQRAPAPRPTIADLEGPVQAQAPFAWEPTELYPDLLFHGPDFRVIQSLGGVSDTGAAAVLVGLREKGWPGDVWKTDVAAIDGGLQLARLWGIHVLGRKSLPTRIGAYHHLKEGPLEGPIRCELRGRTYGTHRTHSDIVFSSQDGTPVAKLNDVEAHMLPDAE